ncbi:MAG: SHOCT domain-containing protein [Clostridia bacterium]|nr:SHOCT domain-containing protein [Clostridia bacterium]
MENGKINANKANYDRQPRILYVIQGVLLIASIIITIIMLFPWPFVFSPYFDTEELVAYLFNIVKRLLFPLILAVGYFIKNNKIIGKTLTISSITVFILYFINMLLPLDSFVVEERIWWLIVEFFFCVFAFVFGKFFLTEVDSKLSKFIYLIPILFGIYFLLATTIDGIYLAEYCFSDSYDPYEYYSYHSPESKFFENFIDGLISRIFECLTSWIVPYLILLARVGKIKIRKSEKIKLAIVQKEGEISVAEKADILKEYKSMLDEGIITAEEYDEKKNSILNGKQ